MTITQKEKILDVNEFEIPDELKALNHWVLWKAIFEEKTHQYKKIPYQTFGNKMAKSTDSSTWDRFDSVASHYQYHNYDGIGFVLSDEDDFIVLDLDNVVNPDTLEIISDLGKEMLQLTYCEISPSRTGLHAFFKGTLPKDRKKKRTDLDIELYDNARFMTVTGYSVGQSEINDDQAILNNLYERFFKNEDFAFTVEYSENQTDSTIDDETLIKKMTSSKNGQKIADLLKGDYQEYFQSPSEAVHSLLWHLAFWTKKNREQMERIFITYNNLTDKWDSRRGNTTWGQLELEKAIQMQPNVYDPESVKPSLQQRLKEVRQQELAQMKAVWEEEGKNGRKPTTIHPNRVAYILSDLLHFVLFDGEENTRVAMYVEDEGIYTQNTSMIKRVISWLEPKFNSNKADDVIYHIKNTAKIKRKTDSSTLIPVKNGVFNRVTKQLEPFTPDYVFTTKINTEYKDDITKPIINSWDIDEWIRSIACRDSEIELLLWQVLNDSLNGNYTRKKIIFLVGEGLNGKGTYQELIINLVGPENVATLKVHEFEERFKLSMLEGKTVCIGDDNPVGVYIDDSSNLKSVATGDRVLVEFKNKQPYGANYKCGVIQSTNGMPKFKDKTKGNLRRILIVPFNASFNGAKENFKIKEEYIKNEKVLQYVLKKAIHMDFESFTVPKASLEQLDEFKQDNDPIYEFKKNVFDTWNLPTIPKYIVLGFYRDFCEENNYKALPERKFYKQFKTYLNDDWDSDGQAKISYDLIKSKIGDINNMNIGIIFNQDGKNYKCYVNQKLKAVN